MSQRAKAKQIQVEASGASTAGTLQELIEDRKIYRPANIEVTAGEYEVEIASSTGTSGVITAATTTKAGAMSKDDKAKLSNLPDAAALNTALSNKVDKVTGKVLSDTNFTQAEKTKLAGIASEATKNRADSENADKIHTHTTAQVTGLDTALESKVDKVAGKSLIEPAPVDGKQYARKDGAWVEVTGGGGTGDVEEAPIDGKQYARKDGDWEEVAASGDVEEAPIDGKTYVRSDGAWAEIDYAAPVTLDFIGVDPADDGQWAPNYLDFPDTSKIYQGILEYKDGYGENATYSARYMQLLGGEVEAWLVEVTSQGATDYPLAYLTSAGVSGAVTAAVQFNIQDGLPTGISRLEGDGVLDYRNLLGVASTNPNPLAFRVDINAGYADVLLETSLYTEGDEPVAVTFPAHQRILDKIGDNAELVPTDFYSLLDEGKEFSYGFTKGGKYWEVNRGSGYTTGTPEEFGYKLTVKSARDEAHTIVFPLI